MLAGTAANAGRFVGRGTAAPGSALAAGTTHLDVAEVAVEDGIGISFTPTVSRESCHRNTRSAPGLVPLADPVDALASWSRRVFAAVRGQGIVEIDGSNPSSPRIVRWLPAPASIGTIEALACSGRELYALSETGLAILDLRSVAAAWEVDPSIRGSELAVAGRLLTVISDSGVERYLDTTGTARLHEVAVNSNFFTPEELTVAIGDTVRWTNDSGDFHNVFSCTEDQLGCDRGASTETFSSGAATGFFVHDHAFTRPGPNPYVCQPHATFMAGSVTVVGTVGQPPVVPDGTVGAPMVVTKLSPDAGVLSIAWDTTSCPGAVDHEMLYGYAFGLPPATGGAYEPAGAECTIGPSSPFVWTSVPPAFPGATGWLWWLVVATDGAATEGSWGTGEAGAERDGPAANGSSGLCGIGTKSLADTCEN
jgi:plastocyanin